MRDFVRWVAAMRFAILDASFRASLVVVVCVGSVACSFRVGSGGQDEDGGESGASDGADSAGSSGEGTDGGDGGSCDGSWVPGVDMGDSGTLGHPCAGDSDCSDDEKCAQAGDAASGFLEARCVQFGSAGFGDPCFVADEFSFDSCSKDLICAPRVRDRVSGIIGTCRDRCGAEKPCPSLEGCYFLTMDAGAGWCGLECEDVYESADCPGDSVCKFDWYWESMCVDEYFETVGPGEDPSGKACPAGTFDGYGDGGLCPLSEPCCVPICDTSHPVPAARCEALGFLGATCVEYGVVGNPVGLCTIL